MAVINYSRVSVWNKTISEQYLLSYSTERNACDGQKGFLEGDVWREVPC